MSVAQMRPTFRIRSADAPEQVMDRIRQAVAVRGEDVLGQFARSTGMISIQQSRRHFWSPWLHFEIQSSPDETRVDESELFCRFSPHPSIWTGIMFSYLGISVMIFFAAVFGFSQQMAGETGWSYVFIPVGLMALAGIWAASKVGQKLAMTEMLELKTLVESCLKPVAD